MLEDNKPIGVRSQIPGISSEIEGAPVSVPGGGAGATTTQTENDTHRDGATTSTDTEHETPGISPEQLRADATAGFDRQIRSVRDFLDASEHRPETKEQREKRERKEKSKRIIAAVSDGLSALGNLFFTTQYAPNMYNHEKSSMGRAVDARIERLKADREKNDDRYLRFSLKLGDLENQRAATLRELEAQQERQRLARKKAQLDEERFQFEKTLWPDRQREQSAKADKAGHDARTAESIADTTPDIQQARLETERARKGSLVASADNSRASASAHRAGIKKHHFRGREYISEKDYTKDVTEAARQYNDRHMEWVEVDDGKGGKRRERRYKEGFVPIVIEREVSSAAGRRQVPRKPEEYAGEVERRLAEEEADNTPPTRRSNNDDNTPPTRRK